jgi:hypothetical protein
MLYPTMTATVLGILFVTALAAVDWYVWGTAGAASYRRPETARPLTLKELSGRFLARVVALNGQVLPANVIANGETKPAQHDEGHGFKRVA